jgi:hypothetical protein
MKAIAEELVSAFNTTITDYDAIDVAVKILEKHFTGGSPGYKEGTATPLRVKSNEGTLVSFSHKKI